jgi:hypothetical protein
VGGDFWRRPTVMTRRRRHRGDDFVWLFSHRLRDLDPEGYFPISGIQADEGGARISGNHTAWPGHSRNCPGLPRQCPWMPALLRHLCSSLPLTGKAFMNCSAHIRPIEDELRVCEA